MAPDLWQSNSYISEGKQSKAHLMHTLLSIIHGLAGWFVRTFKQTMMAGEGDGLKQNRKQVLMISNQTF